MARQRGFRTLLLYPTSATCVWSVEIMPPLSVACLWQGNGYNIRITKEHIKSIKHYYNDSPQHQTEYHSYLLNTMMIDCVTFYNLLLYYSFVNFRLCPFFDL